MWTSFYERTRMVATTIPPAKVKIRTLSVLFYADNQFGYEIHSLSNINRAFAGGDITSNNLKSTWKYSSAAGVEEYEIGRSVRVPEGDALWGPAFVFDPENSEHLERLERLKYEISSRTLTR